MYVSKGANDHVKAVMDAVFNEFQSGPKCSAFVVITFMKMKGPTVQKSNLA